MTDRIIQTIWYRLTQNERNHLIKLLLRDKRIESIRYIRTAGGLGLIEARDFVDSAWLCQQIVAYDPTRMTALQEFKARIICIASDALLHAVEMGCVNETMEVTHGNDAEETLEQILEMCLED